MSEWVVPYARLDGVAVELAVRVMGVPETARFGDEISCSLQLTYHPRVDYGALRKGVEFLLIEGEKTVAPGVCLSDMCERSSSAG